MYCAINQVADLEFVAIGHTLKDAVNGVIKALKVAEANPNDIRVRAGPLVCGEAVDVSGVTPKDWQLFRKEIA